MDRRAAIMTDTLPVTQPDNQADPMGHTQGDPLEDTMGELTHLASSRITISPALGVITDLWGTTSHLSLPMITDSTHSQGYV